MTPTGVLTTLVSFDIKTGFEPYTGLAVEGNDGFLGTTMIGGKNGGGTIFRMTSEGKLTTLVAFSANTSLIGNSPMSELLADRDGSYYGTTFNGSTNGSFAGSGTVFRLTKEGVLTTLAAFMGTNGMNPCGRLLQTEDESLYGITAAGGQRQAGTIFRLSKHVAGRK
jgi:uncharacterized repeat protein (TIGR03803 family)